MSFSSSDLTPLLTPPPSQSIRFGQAKILAWDPDTFENEISWRGVTLTNLPVLAGAEALSFQAGDTVGLLGWGTTAAAGSWWILGRVVLPGTDKGAEAIAWMTGALGRSVSAAVFADRVHTDVSISQAFYSSNTSGFVAHSQGSPAKLSITTGPTGRTLVTLSTLIDWTSDSPGAQVVGNMGVDISGPTNFSASSSRSVGGGETDISASQLGSSYVHEYELDPESEYELTTMYRAQIPPSGGTVAFGISFLQAITL